MRWSRDGLTDGRVWIAVVILMGLAMHGGTAVLRLNTFVPYPRLIDFSAFYTAAAAVSEGLNPYDLPTEWVHGLKVNQRLPYHPPPIYNPVIWAWLLQPFALLAYPAAAWLWITFNLLLLAFCARRLAQLAGIRAWWGRFSVTLLTFTFGPVVLDLSIGQTSVILLTGALTIGLAYESDSALRKAGFLAAQALTASVKLFPLTWLGAFLVQRRWRSLWLATMSTLLLLALPFLALPAANQDYWFRALPGRLRSASASANLDDQSLVAWLKRVALPQQYTVPGIRADERVTVTSEPPWQVSTTAVSLVGYGLLAAGGVLVVAVLCRAEPPNAEGGFYLWVVLFLLAFPHMQRYNHALLLPGAAWLWGIAPKSRGTVAVVYLLTGISRLTHLWMVILPPVLGSVVSGAGVAAALLLGVGLVRALWRGAEDSGLRGALQAWAR